MTTHDFREIRLGHALGFLGWADFDKLYGLENAGTRAKTRALRVTHSR